MASEQLRRRENTTTEREVHIEKSRVPKMATHFEHLAEQVKDSDIATGGNKQETPQGSIEALQGGEMHKEHAGKSIGDVGGRGKARETHEVGAHFESLADKVKKNSDDQGARSENVVRGREGVGGVRNVGKFEMQGEERGSVGREKLEGRTREARGMSQRSEEKEKERRRRESTVGQVVAEKGDRDKFEGRRFGGAGREGAKAKNEEERITGGVSGAGRQGARATNEEERFKGRFGGVEREGAKAKNEEERIKGSVSGVGVGENEGATAAVVTCTLETGGGGGRADVKGIRERKEAPSEGRIETGQAQRNANEVFSDAQNRIQGAKQSTSEALSSTAQTVQEKASQAKDATLEKGQQGYATTKDTLSSAAKTAAEYTAPVAEKAKDYTLQAAETAKSAGGTTVHYVGEKAVQAKDVTVKTGKTAAEYAGKVAADLKDKATVAGWKAAHFSAEMTVEGTKAAANVVEGAAGYAGHKAAELAAKSVDAVKGLAASAGDTAKGYTARKKEEAERELQAKSGLEQEAEERPSQGVGETIGKYAQNVLPTGQVQGQQRQEGTGTNVLSSIGETVGNVGEKIKKPFENLTGNQTHESYQATSGGGKEQQVQGKGSEAMARVGETIGDVAQRVKPQLDSITGNITGGGTEVLGAVGETVGEIGETMIKHAERVQGHSQVGQGSGVLGAIGETIAEIAETTKVMVIGEGESESRQKKNIGSESVYSKHEERSSGGPAFDPNK